MPTPFVAPRSSIVDLDGPVHVADFGGPTDGPLLVGLHGLGGSHLNWAAIAPDLVGHARLVALDLVGHGLTPRHGRTADLEGHRTVVSRWLATQGGTPAILVGNSMGGLVAALQAAAEPETVAGLILIDPALPTARLGLVHPRVIANFVLCTVPGVGQHYLTQRRRHTSAEQSVRRVLGVCCVDPARVPADVVQAHIELTERIDRARADDAYLQSARSLAMRMARPGPTMAALAALDQPVLLLHGQRDVLVPLASAKRMAEAHPTWQFDVARDIGHVPMLEAPTWTAREITGWLAGSGKQAAARASSAPEPVS